MRDSDSRGLSPVRTLYVVDLIWIAIFAALGWTVDSPHPVERPVFFCLAVLQMLHPRVRERGGMRANVAVIAAQLLLTYLLMGYTRGIASSYYALLLLPVLSAATALGGWATAATVTAACACYLSLLLLLDWSRYTIPPDQMRELLLRVSILPMSSLVAWQLAAASRANARRYREAAEELEAVNRSLQETQAAYRRSERLAALGQLTAGLAHELRNPLGTIRGAAEMLEKKLPSGDPLSRELTGFISTEVDRANSLVTRFLEFARPLAPRRVPANLNTVIDNAITSVERQMSGHALVHRNYAPDIPPLPLDPELMERVFFNLVSNAVQASAAGVPVTVKTRVNGSRAEILVIDRGAGIDPAYIETIFNPFFTTKKEGIGLGLAIVSKILDEHGGTVSVESEPGKGSVFQISLPLAAAPPL